MTSSQSEAKWPSLGWPLSGGGECFCFGWEAYHFGNHKLYHTNNILFYIRILKISEIAQNKGRPTVIPGNRLQTLPRSRYPKHPISVLKYF